MRPNLLSALALAPQLEPYKRLLGVLVRQDCVSLALSNPYLNLAEPLGAVMLRNGRLPSRSLQRLLATEQQQLAGFIIAYEVKAGQAVQQGQGQQQQQQQVQQQPLTPQQESAVDQLTGILGALAPTAPGGWYGSWAADASGASCRIMPPGGPAAAAATSSTQQLHQATACAGDASSGSQGSAASSAGAGPEPGSMQSQPRCSLGQQFLQSYLDTLGSLNTFG